MSSGDIRPAIWLCGATSLAEFVPARQWLAEQFELIEVGDAPEDGSQSEGSPLAIIDVRDTYQPAAAEQLRRLTSAQPLSLVLQFLGPWCDGMGRSPGFVPGVLRIRWHCWQVELPPLLEPRNFLPRTATDADRIVERSRSKQPQLNARVAVVALSSVAAEGLLMAVQALGGEAVRWHTPNDAQNDSADQVVIDLPAGFQQIAWLEDWLKAAGDRSVVLLTGYLRPEEVSQFQRQDNVTIVAKPCQLATLQAALQGAIQIASGRA